jgi:hypothetical protein
MYPILQLVDDAKHDTWWLFQWNNTGPGAFEWQWLLINFETRTIWHRYMRDNVCVWNDGDGLWKPKEWALAEAADRPGRPTKTILDVVEETGICVDDEGNWESADDGTESDTDEGDGSEACSVDNEDFNDEDDPGQSINFSDQLFLAFSKAFQ